MYRKLETNMKYTNKASLLSRPLVLVIALLTLAAAIVSVLYVRHLPPFQAKNTTHPISAGQATKGEAISASTSSNTSSQSTSKSSSVTTSPGAVKENTAPRADLIAPTGNFVSAHKNVPLNATLSSVCNTSAGAKCKIVFTSGETTKSLPEQTTDLGGSTFWNSWTPSSIGLTSGEWSVQAVATLNDQTKSTSDAMKLEVVQ